MTDYQWPHEAVAPKRFNVRLKAPGKSRVAKIEDFFSKRLGVDAVLVPSGRAGLAMVFGFLGANRSQKTFAPRFSSFCVWDAIGRFANPTVDLETRADIVLAVHKWGQVEKLADPTRHGVIVEDSVDTVFENTRTLFSLGGICDVLSMPKTIGAYCGGIVLTRDTALAKYLRDQRGKNKKLASYQALLKYQERVGKAPPFVSWHHCEAQNTAIEENGAREIESCLGNLELNADVIRARLELARKRFGAISYDPASGRLPPVLAFPLKDKKPASEVMVRNRNCSGYLDRPEYRPAMLLPLHFGINDRQFQRILDLLNCN